MNVYIFYMTGSEYSMLTCRNSNNPGKYMYADLDPMWCQASPKA